ncbi:MAG: DUF4143 domain-containing protein [Desulfobacterales bacterium]|nr:DUF4143 domain-containing protein [Desulfobacterales bacterium]
MLNEIQAQTQSRRVLYWRDKRGHEVDFVLAKRQGDPVAIECKWSAAEFDAANVKAFQGAVPRGGQLCGGGGYRKVPFQDILRFLRPVCEPRRLNGSDSRTAMTCPSAYQAGNFLN